MNERLRTNQRIRKKADFERLFEKGRFQRGAILNMWVCENISLGLRLGMIVSRKTHAHATSRNIWKRRIREAFRRLQESVKPHVDILVQSKKREKIPSYLEIRAELENLLKKSGAWH